MWDKDERCFVEYLDLEMIGYMTFDYVDQEIHVSSTGSAAYHEFATYKYINNKVTLIEKIIDADSDGYRKTYKLINNELKLTEITESQLR